jgi:hypothetical protein
VLCARVFIKIFICKHLLLPATYAYAYVTSSGKTSSKPQHRPLVTSDDEETLDDEEEKGGHRKSALSNAVGSASSLKTMCVTFGLLCVLALVISQMLLMNTTPNPNDVSKATLKTPKVRVSKFSNPLPPRYFFTNKELSKCQQHNVFYLVSFF